MDTAILMVMISLAGLGFAGVRLMWRILDKRMDRLDAQREADRAQNEKQREADRAQNEKQHRELANQIRELANQIQEQREADRAQKDKQHDEIIALLRDHGERIARIEGRKEALTEQRSAGRALRDPQPARSSVA